MTKPRESAAPGKVDGGRRGKKRGGGGGGGRNCKPNAKCRSKDAKLGQTDFCLRDWALDVQVSSSQPRRQKRWMQVRATVLRGHRCPAAISGAGCRDQPPSLTLWVRRRLWRCDCQKMRAGGRYLVLMRDKRRHQSRQDLVVDRQSIVWQWQPELAERLVRLQSFAGGGSGGGGCSDCDCVARRHRRRRQQRRRRRRQQQRRQRRQPGSDRA